MATNEREQKGWAIASAFGSVRKTSAHGYIVHSVDGRDYYVAQDNGRWVCPCNSIEKCEHLFAIEIANTFGTVVSVKRIDPVEAVTECIFCGSSELEKNGVRKNKRGNIQKYRCKSCGRYFTFDPGFERMKHDPKAITTAMQLYFSGESLRKTMQSLRLLGVEVSHQTVYNWIRKYSALLKKYADKLMPSTSDVWRADELFIKVRGNLNYLFALIDDETRYWIAQEVAETKYTHNARNLFRMAKEVTGKVPTAIITDGLQGYHDAFRKEFYTRRMPRPEHINVIKLQGDMNNNKMERFNGEIRDRERVIRGLKKKSTPIIAGYQAFHNFIRPHEALKGKTPAEICGIEIVGKNKWITLIQNSNLSNINYSWRSDRRISS